MKKKIFLPLIVLFVLVLNFNAFCFSVNGIQLESGPIIILSDEPVENSSAPGLITQFFGVSVPMMFNSVLYFEPGIRLYASNVVLDSDNRAVLSAVETAYRISLLNCEIRPEIGALFNLSDKISLGITGAPLFTFRIPIVAHDYDDGSEAMSTVGQYFLAKARFLSLYAGGLLVWHATEKVSLEVKLGTSLPFYHFWDGEDSAFYNWLSIEPEVGFIFSF